MADPVDRNAGAADSRAELMRRIAAAPEEHAEALLAAWQTLQVSHDKGVLDLVKGLLGGSDIVAAEVARAAGTAEGVNALRNAVALVQMLGGTDPDMLARLAQSFAEIDADLREEAKQAPPSLREMYKRITSENGLRGLSVVTRLIVALGQASTK